MADEQVPLDRTGGLAGKEGRPGKDGKDGLVGARGQEGPRSNDGKNASSGSNDMLKETFRGSELVRNPCCPGRLQTGSAFQQRAFGTKMLDLYLSDDVGDYMREHIH